MSIKTLQQAAKFFETEIKFMSEHGWTETAYIERYGTTEQPKMGDGGPLIWEADIWALFRARDHFLAVIQSFLFASGNAWRKKCPLAAKIWDTDLLGLPKAIDQIHRYQTAADRLIESMKTSST